jgi:ATP-dependent Clp protease adaptor protein ClpS
MKTNIQLDRYNDELEQEAEPQLKEPSLFQVVMHNDDYTPMEFVVAVLEAFFYMDSMKAARMMQQIHVTGKAICGVFTKDVAETKAELVVDYARRHEHPLLCSIEAT